MCYSSRIEADYRRYLRDTGASVSLHDFRLLFWERSQGRKVKVPRAVEDAFLAGTSDAEAEIAGLIRTHREAESLKLQQDLFAQRARLAEAERKLAAKPTKTAAESKRIALGKIECGRRCKSEPPRRPNIEPGVEADVEMVGCG